MAANSPYESAPTTVSTPVTIQTTSNHPGDPTCFEMPPETIKMPDPIMDPATIIVESSKPSPRMNPVLFVCAIAAASAIRSSSFYADLRNTLSFLGTASGRGLRNRAAIITEFDRPVESFQPFGDFLAS